MDVTRRRREVRGELQRAGVDALVLMPGPNLLYLLGYQPHADERPCYLLLTPAGEVMVVPELNATDVQAHVALPLEPWSDEEGPARALGRAVARLGLGQARRVLLDEAMRFDFVLHLQRQLPEAEFDTAESVLAPLRMVKDQEEIEALAANAAMADEAVRQIWAALRPGLTEAQVAGMVVEVFTGLGAEETAFAIVASGPHTAFPHHSPGPRALGAGEPVLLDIGGRLRGYHGDITRMAFLGEPDPDYRRVHAVVESALVAGLDAVRPGRPLGDVDRAARAAIAQAGFGPFFTHRVGHGLGLTVHEPPYVTAQNTTLMQEGMVFTVEPGVYLPGRFGVRLEEVVVVEAQGARVLSALPRDVHVLPADPGT